MSALGQKMFKFFSLALSASMLFTGCATIMNGTEQTISINSNVTGAQVLLNGKVVGATPMSIKVKKKSGTTITVRKEGYIEQSMVLKTRVAGWFWGNLITGGLPGSTTDAVSGAMFEYSTDSFYANLSPEKQSKVEQQQFQKLSELRHYLLMNYDQLSQNIAAGKGEYLKTLVAMLEVGNSSEEAKLIKQLRSIYSSTTSIIDFSDQVIKLL